MAMCDENEKVVVINPSDKQQSTAIIKPAASNQPLQEDNREDYFRSMPKTPENAFPPDLQTAVELACLGTEAHPMAVALHYVTYFASHIGQHRHIMIGNEKHSLDFYGILVGMTGKVKGTAEAQVSCIEEKGIAYLKEKYKYKPPRKMSGLSSGEGLIQSIRDPLDNEDTDGVMDKRVLVIESEYANVLTQDQRGGNILSMVLRDSYHGKRLSKATTSPQTATDPHISIIGHITPGEFINHPSFNSQSVNGALNRNLIFFAQRGKHKSIPRSYTNKEKGDISHWFAESIFRARDRSTNDSYLNKKLGSEMVMSQEAIAVIEEEYYQRESAQDVMPEQLANLVARHRVFVWRLSAIFALMDGTDTIEAEYIRQVYRWLDYSIESIRYLLNTARQEAEQEEHIILGDEIYEFLLTCNGGKGCSLTEINKVLFGGNKRSKDIKPALKYLTECVPAKVECYQPEKQGRGKRKTIFCPLVRN